MGGIESPSQPALAVALISTRPTFVILSEAVAPFATAQSKDLHFAFAFAFVFAFAFAFAFAVAVTVAVAVAVARFCRHSERSEEPRRSQSTHNRPNLSRHKSHRSCPCRCSCP